MSTVTLDEIKSIEASPEIIEEWGERIVACYEFLITICEGDSFKKCRHFMNEVLERFSMALH
jgi:hypothetical protein